jgi:predicted Rossmann fold flavoprotein
LNPTDGTQPQASDIAIVGAGAAGLMAAIFAGRTLTEKQGKPPAPGQVLLIDSAPKPGAKILVAGGGRCNVTHDEVYLDDYNTPKPNQLAITMRTFGVEETIWFFSELGVELKREETGKLFPVTDSARTVLDALLNAASQAGVTFRFGEKVDSISQHGAPANTPDQTGNPVPGSPMPDSQEPGYTITTNSGTIQARRVILCTGGKSLPKTGSDGHGYTIAQSLGHSVTQTFPALVPLVIDENHWIKTLSGLTLQTCLSVALSTGKVLKRETESTLLTHFGLSGPGPLNISRHLTMARQKDPQAKLLINWLPEQTRTGQDPFLQIEQELLEAAEKNPRQFAYAWLSRRMTGRLADAILRHEAQIPGDMPVCQISRDKRRQLARSLTAMPVPVARDRGYLFAEVTAGGVPLDEIKPQSMASRKSAGLYLAGEVLDVDGKIGGYNFQWAWASGRLAGQSAAMSLMEQ